MELGLDTLKFLATQVNSDTLASEEQATGLLSFLNDTHSLPTLSYLLFQESGNHPGPPFIPLVWVHIALKLSLLPSSFSLSHLSKNSNIMKLE